MTRPVSRHVALWIDLQQAILLAFEAEPLDGSALHRPGEGRSQDRVGAHQYPSTQQYFGAVLSYLKPRDEILILGPGQAKLELRHQIEQQGGLKGKVVGLHDACRLAKVEVVFPTSEPWHSENAGEVQVDTSIPRTAERVVEELRAQR
jgi:hypothetical protein